MTFLGPRQHVLARIGTFDADLGEICPGYVCFSAESDEVDSLDIPQNNDCFLKIILQLLYLEVYGGLKSTLNIKLVMPFFEVQLHVIYNGVQGIKMDNNNAVTLSGPQTKRNVNMPLFGIGQEWGNVSRGRKSQDVQKHFIPC